MQPNRLFFPRLLAICGALLLPATTYAQPEETHGRCPEMGAPDGMGRHGGPQGPEHGFMAEGDQLPPFLHGIDLTESQRDAVFTLLHNQAPTLRARGQALRKAREALHALARTGKYDETKAKGLAEEIAHNSGAIALLMARAEHGIYALLTPEQHKKIDARKHGESFFSMHGKPGGAGREARAI